MNTAVTIFQKEEFEEVGTAIKNDEPPVRTTSSSREQGKSIDIAAKMMNVGSGTVQDALRVKRHGAPEVVRKVQAGDISVVTGSEKNKALPPSTSRYIQKNQNQ